MIDERSKWFIARQRLPIDILGLPATVIFTAIPAIIAHRANRHPSRSVRRICPSVWRLSKVSAFLRRKYRHGVYPIDEDASISFYHGGDALCDDRLPLAIVSLHYRVARGGGGRSLRLLWSDRIEFDSHEVEELTDSIEAGSTIRDLRADIAACLGVDDSSRVVVSVRDGLRPGLLQGNNWETRRVDSWLCQTLFIDLVAEGNYIVVKGVNEEYIFHPFSCSRPVGSRTLKTWLHERILTNVGHPKSSSKEGAIDLEDISMSVEGKPLGRHSRVGLGSTVEFQLARRAHDQFVQEEGWLLAESETCVVCSDEKRVSEFPARITKACDHQPATCRDCVGQWIASSMESVSWDRLKCPECSGLLAFEDVGAFAYPATFESLPWHRNETCEAYDRRTRRQRKGDKASEKKVKEMTKSCPRCRKDVYKYSGCDHITCVCGHEWCYVCLGEYYHDQDSFLQCSHKRSCRYFQNPPNYEGGRAFMPFMRPANMRPPPPHHLPPGAARPAPFLPWGFPPRPPLPHRPLGRPPTPAPPLDQANRIHDDHAGDGEAGFVGAAAMFTMDQFLQRAR
ncbi:hypothetical protein PG984_001983 [Apiospora sp. TS-2023a]